MNIVERKRLLIIKYNKISDETWFYSGGEGRRLVVKCGGLDNQAMTNSRNQFYSQGWFLYRNKRSGQSWTGRDEAGPARPNFSKYKEKIE